MKIGWICTENYEAAQSRIRVLNINQWLGKHGYNSNIVPYYSQIINGAYDICIVGKSFTEDDFKGIEMVKKQGILVYCDLCESLFEFPWVREILAICDRVICCSDALADLVRPINPRVTVIEDAVEADNA